MEGHRNMFGIVYEVFSFNSSFTTFTYSKEFRYILINEEKLFAAYFNDIALFQLY